MRTIQSRPQVAFSLAMPRSVATTLTLLSSTAFAHTGNDGGSHHEWLNMAQQLTDLQAWLAGLTVSPWDLWLLVAAGVWLAAHWAQRNSKCKPRSDPRENQP